MKLGAVAETITVSGEAPVVDLQSTAQTTAANAKAFKELPTGGSWVNMAQLIPAINSAFFGTRDVGGVLGDQTGAQVSAHGGCAGDGVSMIDGMRIGNMYHQLELDEHEPVAADVRRGQHLALGSDAGNGHQRRDHERDSEVGRQPVPQVRCS